MNYDENFKETNYDKYNNGYHQKSSFRYTSLLRTLGNASFWNRLQEDEKRPNLLPCSTTKRNQMKLR